MKKLLYFFLVLGLIMLTAGCTHTSREPRLVAVDSMLATRPDSALALLRQDLRSSFRKAEGSSEADRMYYYLLLADACNKCYDTLPSDSVMHLVADFYDAHGTPNEQVRAHYLLGCVYRDLGEAPQALDCYHTALDRADTTASDCNYHLLSRVQGQCADLFLAQEVPQMALESMKEAEHYATLAKDTLTAIICYERTSIVYAAMSLRDSSISVNYNASRKYAGLNYPVNAMMAKSANILYLLEEDRYQDAKRIMDIYEQDTNFFDNNGNIRKGLEKYYYEKGIYYLFTNDLDSAEQSFRKELRLGTDLNNQEAATNGLYKLYVRLGKTDSIAKYARLCYAYCDSASQLRSTELMARMQAIYQYERYKQQAKKNAEETIKARKLLFVSITFIILLVMILLLYYRYTVKREKKLYLKLVAVEKDRTLHELNNMERELFNSSIVGELRNDAHKGKTPMYEQWNTLFSLSHQLIPSFMNIIENPKNGLRVEEQQICLLIRLRFKPKEISVLTGMSLSSISNVRKRLLKRIFNIEKGSSRDFDKLLLEIQ